MGLQRGIYTAMGGTVGGVLLGTAAAAALQQSEGEPILPELQSVFGVREGNVGGRERQLVEEVGDGEVMDMDDSEFVEDKA